MNILKMLFPLLIVSLVSGPVCAQLTPIFQFKKTKEKDRKKGVSPADSVHINKMLKSSKNFSPGALDMLSFSEIQGVLKENNDKFKPGEISSLVEKRLNKLNKSYSFLSTTSTPSSFNIFDIRKYNIDTLNKYIYNQGGVSAFQSSSIQNFNGIHTDINVEFASFLFGPVRLGVAGSFQTKGDTTKNNAIKSSLQKIVSNGGAINLNFLLPVYFFRTQDDQTHFAIFALSRNSINPGIDSTGTTDYSTNLGYTNQTGLDAHFDVGSNDNKARLYFDVPFFYSISTNNVNKQLSLPNFLLMKLEIGVVLGDLVKFNISGPVFSSSSKVQHSPYLISLQFSPTQLVKSSPN